MKPSAIDLIACLSVLVAACATDGSGASERPADHSTPAPAKAQAEAENAAVARTASAQVETKEMKAPAALSPAEALGFLVVVNDHEIAAAREAEQRSLSPGTTAFAKRMVEQHSDNNGATKELARKLGRDPEENSEARALRQKGESELADLAAQDDRAFERAYVDAMIEGHEAVLKLIDEKLLPAARDGELRRHLEETRRHVAEHLEEARKLAQVPRRS